MRVCVVYADVARKMDSQKKMDETNLHNQRSRAWMCKMMLSVGPSVAPIQASEASFLVSAASFLAIVASILAPVAACSGDAKNG